ncbi:hypothetical protein D3C80_1649860 [compost metagenome]
MAKDLVTYGARSKSILLADTPPYWAFCWDWKIIATSDIAVIIELGGRTLPLPVLKPSRSRRSNGMKMQLVVPIAYWSRSWT